MRRISGLSLFRPIAFGTCRLEDVSESSLLWDRQNHCEQGVVGDAEGVSWEIVLRDKGLALPVT